MKLSASNPQSPTGPRQFEEHCHTILAEEAKLRESGLLRQGYAGQGGSSTTS